MLDLQEIKYPPTGEVLKINTLWLRDHCRCTKCYNERTKQRLFDILDLPMDARPIKCSYSDDGRSCEITWNDGHVSVFDMEFLYNSQLDQLKKRLLKNSSIRCPWNVATIKQYEPKLRLTLSELMGTEHGPKHLVECLCRYGIVFIDNVEPTLDATSAAIRRVFPIMKTLFGEMCVITDALDFADMAYSRAHLGLHTDNTYFANGSGLLMLHCLEHKNGDGGESFFADGLKTALELKKRNPKAFEVLTRVPVPAEYVQEGQNHWHAAPLIRLDPFSGEIAQMRLNINDRAPFDTLAQDEMREFYTSFREYMSILHDPSNIWKFKLHPGTMVVLDNWRVYHGRCSYTGFRKMTSCYVDRTDFTSQAKLKGILE